MATVNSINSQNPIQGTFGGSGVNNGTKLLTLGGDLTTSGAFNTTFTMTNTTSVTFPTSGTLATTAGTVASVTGTADRITSTGGTTPVIDIASTYVGQTSLTTLGTIATGVWNGTIITGTYGGTGVNNGASTITLAGNLVTSGANSLTFTTTGATNVTLPTSGTLATVAATVSSITGTANQITASASTGAVTLSVPDDLYVGTAAGSHAGTISFFPSTASRGKTVLSMTDNAGDTTTSVAFAAQSGARTYTVPDAGASADFVMDEGAQTIGGVKTFSSASIMPALGAYSLVSGFPENAALTTTITSAQLLLLNTTPIEVVPAQGAGTIVVFLGMLVYSAGGSVAYAATAGKSFSIRYSTGSGSRVSGQFACTGFFDGTTARRRWLNPMSDEADLNISMSSDNVPLVAFINSSNMTTGDFGITVRVWYKVIQSVI